MAEATSLRTRLSALSPARRALLEKLLQAEDAKPPPLTVAARGSTATRFPLSYAQQRLWFLDQLMPGQGLYNMPTVLHLTGELDVAALARTFAELVRRHEALRTSFTSRQGRPEQVVHAPSPWRLPVVDLHGLPAAAQEAEALRLARQESVRPFDLERAPLLRTTLIRLDAAAADRGRSARGEGF